MKDPGDPRVLPVSQRFVASLAVATSSRRLSSKVHTWLQFSEKTAYGSPPPVDQRSGSAAVFGENCAPSAGFEPATPGLGNPCSIP